jgi:hypothetical protein
MGVIIRTYKTKPKESERKKLCAGCSEDFYNGNNPLGVKKCWCFESAKKVDKNVYYSIHQVKPSIRRRTLNCWSPNR